MDTDRREAMSAKRSPSLFFALAGMLAFSLPAARGDQPTPKPLVIDGVENIQDIKYLPDWRYSGNPSLRRDYEMLLNLYLPPVSAGKKLPLVIYVHGGAYSAGYKDEGYMRELFEVLTKSGIAVASLNYILFSKGILPQVFWDYEDAVRFLRLNADKYHLDPNAFGAIGISAGGWLISTAGHANGETFSLGINQGVRLSALSPPDFVLAKPGAGDGSFLRPILAPATAYPGTYGRVQALALDFSSMNDDANGFTPAILEFVGEGYTPPHTAAFTAAGVDWAKAVLVHPKYKGHQVHVPKMVNQGHEAETSLTRTLDGKGEAQLADVIRDWFLEVLTGPQARTPVPEIWPTDRLLTGPVEVSMLVPDPAIAIRYTTDGSNPGDSSPLYTKPFTVQPGTRVRAFTSLPGRRASRIVEAAYVQATPRPVITAPEARELPPATTGKPYSVTFQASLPGARFCVQGELRPRIPDKSKTMFYPNGMAMDGKGVWSGIPTTPGTFWVQIWVNDGPGRVATHRDYRWTVTGDPIGPQKPGEELKSDTNQPIATLRAWRNELVDDLRDRLQVVGVRAIFQDGAERSTMLLVPADQSQKAKQILGEYMAQHPKETAADLDQ
jgi:acetyl esterase/lipase